MKPAAGGPCTCPLQKGTSGRFGTLLSLQHGSTGLLSCTSHHKTASTSIIKPNGGLQRCTGTVMHVAAQSCVRFLTSGWDYRF